MFNRSLLGRLMYNTSNRNVYADADTTLAGAAAVSLTGTKSVTGDASLAGVSAVTPLANKTISANATAAGVASVSSVGIGGVYTDAILAGAASMTAQAFRLIGGTSSLSGVGGVAITGNQLTGNRSATLTGIGGITAGASKLADAPVLRMNGFADPVFTGHFKAGGSGAAMSTSSMDAIITAIRGGVAEMNGRADGESAALVYSWDQYNQAADPQWEETGPAHPVWQQREQPLNPWR